MKKKTDYVFQSQVQRKTIPNEVAYDIYQYFYEKQRNIDYIHSKLKKKGTTLQEVKATIQKLQGMTEVQRKRWAYDIQRQIKQDKKKKSKKKKKTKEQKPLKGLIEIWIQRSCALCKIYWPELKKSIEQLKKKYSKEFEVKIRWCWDQWLPNVGELHEINEVEVMQRWDEVVNDLETRALGILHFPALTISGTEVVDAQMREGTEFFSPKLYDMVSYILEQELDPQQAIPFKFAPDNPEFKIIKKRLMAHGGNPRWD